MKTEYKPKAFFTDYTKSYIEDGTFYQSPKVPSVVVLKPTLKCNARCKHCNPRSKRFDNERTFTLQEYDDLVTQLKALGTKQVSIACQPSEEIRHPGEFEASQYHSASKYV